MLSSLQYAIERFGLILRPQFDLVFDLFRGYNAFCDLVVDN